MSDQCLKGVDISAGGLVFYTIYCFLPNLARVVHTFLLLSCDICQIRVRNLTYLQPFSRIILAAHTEVTHRSRVNAPRGVQHSFPFTGGYDREEYHHLPAQ